MGGTSVPTLCQKSPSGLKSLAQDSLLRNEDWLGSVSLLHDDHPRIRDYSPWLASLYVRPQARGHGVGAALVAHCIAAARGLGVARLFLYCELPLLPFYARLGWALETLVELPPLPRIAVMAIDTAAAAR
ncbi:MAG: GNAT family N-acetyltransferase [Pseudomonas sp.]